MQSVCKKCILQSYLLSLDVEKNKKQSFVHRYQNTERNHSIMRSASKFIYSTITVAAHSEFLQYGQLSANLAEYIFFVITEE